ncbi:MBL fold metallo-hydrolase [Paenibacillus sp. WLX1005]|uniref:MBL fold metallo-hydrolase n=1 Tax=Paenibacillus sp. WLX1005 TaxID=3243766 RepID=UPI003983E84C
MKINSNGHLHQLVYFPGIFPVNCYLIEENESLTLIDAGLPTSYKGIQQAEAQLGKPLTRIVLTHVHSDHIGSLDKLVELYPGIEVYVSRRDARLMNGDMSLDAHEAQTPIKGGVPKHLKTRPTQLLDEGDTVGSLQVIEVPGHTPGSIALLDTRNRFVIAGDAFQTRGGIAVAGDLRFIFPFPALATWSKADALQSAQKLLQLQPALLAIGHGDMIQQPAQQMQRAIQQAASRWNIVLSLL